MTADTDRESALMDALVQASFVTMATLTSVAADLDVSLTQLRVLAILRDRAPGISTLAEHLGLERSTMSGLIDRAEKRGLVARVPDPGDRRAVRITLTEGGARLVATGLGQVTEALAPLLRELEPGEQEQLHRLLVRSLPVGDV